MYVGYLHTHLKIIFILLNHGLFNYVGKNSDYIASNGKMINEILAKNAQAM